MIGRSFTQAFWGTALLLAQSMVLVTSEIINFGMILDADSGAVHFVHGFLQAPASIDLSGVRWITNEEIIFELDDAYDYDGDLEFIDDEFDDDEWVDDELGGFTETQTLSPAESELDVPAPEPTGDVGENNATVTEENDNGEDVEDVSDITGEENEEEEGDQIDPVISSENELSHDHGNQGKNHDKNNHNKNNHNKNATEPVEPANDGGGDENGESTSEEKGTDESPGDTTNEADENNDVDEAVTPSSPLDEEDSEGGEDTTNEADENNDVDGEIDASSPLDEEDSEGEEEDTTNGLGDELNENEEQQESAPLEKENDVEGEEEKGGQAGDEVDNDQDDQKEGESGGDENQNGNDEVDEEVGDDGENNEKNEQNDEGGNSSEEKESDETTATSATVADDTEAPTSAPTHWDSKETEDGGDRNLQNFEFKSSTATNQIVEIVLFSISDACPTGSAGDCDWVPLGVGSYDEEMEEEMSYCCSEDTATRGLCNFDDIGMMMINHDIFEGFHRKIQVPSEPLEDFEMDEPLFQLKKSGDYVMVIANCNDDGLGVITLGNMEWKSVGGYLPGDMFGLMLFYGAMTGIYVVFGLWYYYGMKMFQEAAIPIQKYILGTIILGFLATAFQEIDLLFWNINGMRNDVLKYIAVAVGVLFQGSLRCLGVMVAMGWGVVRDTLGLALCKIIMLGLLYSGVTLVRDALNAAASSSELVSSTEEEELFDLALVLSLVILAINVIFYLWIISSVRTTTEYLSNMNQFTKLRRHLRLRCLIITSLVIAVALTLVNLVQNLPEYVPKLLNVNYPYKPILNQDQVWIVKAVGYGNYLFILFGVTILWRPNADAKDYAMSMQVPTLADDENDLDLQIVVPSADDMDTGEGYKINDAIAT